MNRHEQQRALVIAEMDRGTLSVGEGAAVLGISVRQGRRVLDVYRQWGIAAVVRGNRGRVPVNAVDEETRQAVVRLASERYVGFNQVHLTEQLSEREGFALSRSSVRRILGAAGIGSPRTRRAPQHRSRRPRYPQAGMLVQIDASPHDWLEGRGARLTLFAAIDDATGELLALLFRAGEDAQGYFLLVRAVVTTHGRPVAVYHDRHSIFRVNAPETVAEQLAGEREPTQFGRLLDELGITSVAARSPQAKGQVERLFGTLQDRLTSMLRPAGATNEGEASACLAHFLTDYNTRFMVPTAEEGACYRAMEGERTAIPFSASRISGQSGWTTPCVSAGRGCNCCPVGTVGRGRGRWSKYTNGWMAAWRSRITESVWRRRPHRRKCRYCVYAADAGGPQYRRTRPCQSRRVHRCDASGSSGA